jgi:hypothetical protein
VFIIINIIALLRLIISVIIIQYLNVDVLDINDENLREKFFYNIKLPLCLGQSIYRLECRSISLYIRSSISLDSAIFFFREDNFLES